MHCSCWRLAGLAQRAVLGVDDAGMRMRVETEVRSAFDRMSRRLREMALEAGDPATIRAAIEADTAAVRRLLSNAAAVVSREAPFDSAITIYGGDGEPRGVGRAPLRPAIRSASGRGGVVRSAGRVRACA